MVRFLICVFVALGLFACEEPDSGGDPDAAVAVMEDGGTVVDAVPPIPPDAPLACNLDLVANAGCDILVDMYGDVRVDENVICFRRNSYRDQCGFVFATHFEQELCPQ